MVSAEAAVFEISENACVSFEALMLVCELIEECFEDESARFEVKRFALSKRGPKPRKGKRDEATSTLDSERGVIEKSRDRGECPPKGNSAYGRGNSHHCSRRKGGEG